MRLTDVGAYSPYFFLFVALFYRDFIGLTQYRFLHFLFDDGWICRDTWAAGHI
jgi:hypothetical protein